MSNFFVLSFLLSIPAFFLGIVNPKWVAAPTRKRSAAMYGGLMAAWFVLVGFTAPNPHQPVSVAPALLKPEIDRNLPFSVKSVARTAEIALDAPQPKEDTKKVIYESSESNVKNADFPSCVNSDCNCSDFTTRAAAQRVLEAFPGDPFKLDRDKDSIACETLP